MKINITFLGTSGQIPTASRNHTAILVQYNEENILIDCGEGTQRQFRKAKINPGKITKILITHWHGDHILGLPGLFQTLALNGYKKELEIYGPKGTSKYIKEILNIFKFKNKLKMKIKEITSGKVAETKDLLINSRPMNHGAPSLAYSIEEKEKIRIDKKKLAKLKIPNSKLIGQLAQGKNINLNGKTIKASDLTYKEPGKKLTIIMDTKTNPSIKTLAENSDLLICESTFLDNSDNGKQLAEEYKHMTAKQAAQIAKSSKAKELILTHISQRYEHKDKLILKEAQSVFKNTKLAKDLMVVEI
ncbi:MAG: ribonuclease Z [Nanoarchaeota archaeon]|nr:ribonuclease Z [Nanoarchaeota archaeon]